MKRQKLTRLAALVGSAAILMATTIEAGAHAALVSAEPGVEATVASPEKIALHFSEAIEPSVSSVEITDSHGNAVAVTRADASDDRSLAATPNAPLAAGMYTVSWATAGDDGHRVTGTFAFTVE